MFLAHGYHDAHLKNLRQIYSQRWHIMNEGIKCHLPMFAQGEASGGTLSGSPGHRILMQMFLQHVFKNGGC